MTEEEAKAQREREEAERLIREINRLQGRINNEVIENKNLQLEIKTLVKNVEKLTANAQIMDNAVNESMNYVANKIEKIDVNTTELFRLLDDLTESYFSFKNLSTASKNISQLTDEYYTKFAFFNELRRITLGYVIGLDAHICSDEVMRKKVEKVYLQNTDYWLAYASMAVMLWAADEEEAANRALAKALSINSLSSSLFFLLINLRFTRIDTAKKWYLLYLDRIDMENMGEEWQYLLQAYLSGAIGADREFQNIVKKYFLDMLSAMESMKPDYGQKVIEKAKDFADCYIYITENEYENLRRYSPEYSQMKTLISKAEKNEVLAVYFKKLFESNTEKENDLFQRIENILYSLISAYDKEEYKVIMSLKYNEMVIKAKGDLAMAQQFYNLGADEENKKRSLDELLFEWAFSEDERVDISVKKFSLYYLKKWVCVGFEKFSKAYREEIKDMYLIEIDGWREQCSESTYEQSRQSLEKHYNKNILSDTFKDKYVLIFSGMCLGALIILFIMTLVFNKTAFVIGILLGILGGFLLWRRIADIMIVLRKKRKKGCMLLKNTLDEMKQWREAYYFADEKNQDLLAVLSSEND